MPVIVLFAVFGNVDMGLTVSIVLGAIIYAIKIRWDLRKHVWFWAVIILILALHVPLFFWVRWPQGNVPTRVYAMPFATLDFFIVIVLIDIADSIFSKDSSLTTINWR